MEEQKAEEEEQLMKTGQSQEQREKEKEKTIQKFMNFQKFNDFSEFAKGKTRLELEYCLLHNLSIQHHFGSRMNDIYHCIYNSQCTQITIIHIT